MRRITFISDTHGQHNDPDLFPDVGEGWMLVHAGDCGNHGCRDEVENFLQWFSVQKYEHKVMIAGNHDYALSRGCTIPRSITYLEDKLVVIDGVRVYGTPWTRRYSDMVFELQQGEELDRVGVRYRTDWTCSSPIHHLTAFSMSAGRTNMWDARSCWKGYSRCDRESTRSAMSISRAWQPLTERSSSTLH